MPNQYKLTLTVELYGQFVTLIDDKTSGDNPSFALHDVQVSLADMGTQLQEIIPALVGRRQL